MVFIRGAAIGLLLAAAIGFFLARHLHRAQRERIDNQARIHGGDLWAAG